MEAFLSRKKPRLTGTRDSDQDVQHTNYLMQQASTPAGSHPTDKNGEDDADSTDVKLAILLSLFPDSEPADLLDVLVACDGSVEKASARLSEQKDTDPRPFQARTAAPSVAASSTPRASPTNTKSCVTNTTTSTSPPNPRPGAIQTSLSCHISSLADGRSTSSKPLTRRGRTLHLYSPQDVAHHTPCSIIHNFLPASEANALLVELLAESRTFTRHKFQLFNRTVESPHTASLYVASAQEQRAQLSEYIYAGTYRTDVRQATPHLRAVSARVQKAVNEEIRTRIETKYPGGKKLRYQSPREWRPNAAFVNCYDGPTEAVGFHSDELTYVGPRAVIGSLSLGVEREFRVRRIVAAREASESEDEGDEREGAEEEDDDDEEEDNEHVEHIDPASRTTEGHGEAGEAGSRDGSISNRTLQTTQQQRKEKKKKKKKKKRNDASSTKNARADAQGQISIHLPHNSLLVMHAEMQEEWKHAIAPAQTISPHPIAGNRRINVTYRWYRDSLHPRYIPRCRCGSLCILRCVQRKRDTRGRYMWMCYRGFTPGKESCSFFQWAEFDDDGEPLWIKKPGGNDIAILKDFAGTNS